MVHDRGSIKWTSLMLPEHVKILKDMEKEDRKIIRPILDEQEVEMINQRLVDACIHEEEVRLAIFEDGYINHYNGKIKINKEQHQVHLNNQVFHFVNIINVEKLS
ncbi:YolD-like family protein [Ornithinibacillus salinisoli]|uniref:YolD-like family protein n=1 Tax=Ornithinibacillus salinisoli TaxID=1848459 RepID=A0ABW4W386_9BACI